MEKVKLLQQTNHSLPPPGYLDSHKEISFPDDSKPRNINRLKTKKAWDIALSTISQVPMNAFMLYMSGSQLQIFSIMVPIP